MPKTKYSEIIYLRGAKEIFEESVMVAFSKLDSDDKNAIQAKVEYLMENCKKKNMGFKSWLCLLARMGIYMVEQNEMYPQKRRRK